ncbi:MAG TPA: TIM-barrel domain-containing protein [Chryseosolibacter sp.]
MKHLHKKFMKFSFSNITIVMRKFTVLLLAISFPLSALHGQAILNDSGGRFSNKSTVVDITFYGPSMVRVNKSPVGITLRKQSLSVVSAPMPVPFKLQRNGNETRFITDSIQVIVDEEKHLVSFRDKTGKLLLAEKASAVFKLVIDAGVQNYSPAQTFGLDQNELIYGLGQHQNGKMSQRFQTIQLVQDNLEDAVPFYQSTKGYGLFWDNYSSTTFRDDSTGLTFESEVGDCVDYYFMFGKNADGVIKCFRTLTGKVPMFPLWTYGYWQSRERYKTQDELVEVLDTYRSLKVPIDGIIQDWQYWGNNYLWNAMDFLNPGFYDPRKMIKDVHDRNAHIMISVWSSFGPQTKQYEILKRKNLLFDFKTWPPSGADSWPPDLRYPSGVRIYDAFSPEARQVYWDFLEKGLVDIGIDSWWMDSTEPDMIDVKPEDLDQPTYLGSFRSVRNAYPLMSVGGVAENLRRHQNDKRVFILTRSAFAGQQRFGVNVWSGDVIASWDALKNQITAGLNLSLCGIPHWNSDIGGFFLTNFPNALSNAEYRELYVRWLQFGTFCPMMRSHGTGAPREIYQFGKKGEPVYNAIEAFIKLRYRLLPYIYSLSWDVSANHSTFMRALMMDFPKDRRALEVGNQYMFGKSFLVAPVIEPMIKWHATTAKKKKSDSAFTKVYLPAGVQWHNFWSGELYNGGQFVDQALQLDQIPLYVKAGSIIAMGPDVSFATEKKWNELNIHIYEGADAAFTLYEDENDNYNYESGKYTTIEFKWDDRTKTLSIGSRNGAFNGMINNRTFNIILRGRRNNVSNNDTSRTQRSVTYNGNQIEVPL